MKSYSFLNQLLSNSNTDGMTLALKSEIDFMLGRNEELRGQLSLSHSELAKSQAQLAKAQDELERLHGDVRFMNATSSAKDIFQPFKLPPGMSPSSQDIIAALNEYLLDTLQELEEYRRVCGRAEKELDNLKRKFAVSRHQIGILYREHFDAHTAWKTEKEKLEGVIGQLNDAVAVDAVKLQEYDRLLETLQHDEPEVRRRLAESSRKMHVVRASERQLQRKCEAMEEVKQVILKENKKMRVDVIEMEIAVRQRIGYLERYRDMANFRIQSLQNQLEESVPVVKLDLVNREYTEVVANYRALLDKQDRSEQLGQTLSVAEQLNRKYESEIEMLRRELENSKDKINVLEETLNRMKNFSIIVKNGAGGGGGGEYEASQKSDPLASADSSVLSMAKRLTAIEMKELNERQRADHAQRMYDQQRNVLRELENRNLELEQNFRDLTKKFLSLEKSEQLVREQLSQFVPKNVSEHDKRRIRELESEESRLRLEVSRLRELTEITLYQTQSLEFISHLSKTQLDLFSLIDVQTLTNDEQTNSLGKMHRQLILMQLSEATAVRKLQQSESKCRRLEAQLVRSEQKYDKENLEFYLSKKEYISKITYLRSTVQDLRHKYTGAIPLKQQERYNAAKEQLAAMRQELSGKLLRVNEEKHELEDRLAEYNSRVKEIEALKSAATVGKDGTVKFNERFLDSFKKSENLKMLNLKLERANRRYKDEIKFLEEMNRKHEIALVALEEDNLRLEAEFDQRMLIWEHREADLERTVEHLKKQHRLIENLAISFEEISGNMPDSTLPVANQLEQAMSIIRSHIKLLAEAKLQSDLSKKRVEEAEARARKLESEVNLRDKVIADLRLRLPASMDRDLLIKSSMHSSETTGHMQNGGNTPVKAAQATIESLQSRLKQKDETLAKYQDMLKLARDEIANVNKQHEIEINSMLDKLNLTRDSNLQKLKQELRSNSMYSETNITRIQLARLQELEEIVVEQDNQLSALNQKIKKLTAECDTWKARTEVSGKRIEQETENMRKEHLVTINRLTSQIETYKEQISEKEKETSRLNAEGKGAMTAGSNDMKSVVDRLKKQLAEKEEQHKTLNQVLAELKGDMMNLARNGLVAGSDPASEKRWHDAVEKTSAEYQDKLLALGDELSKARRELKEKSRVCEELRLEVEYVRSQMKSKEQRIKRLADENQKLTDDGRHGASNKIATSFSLESQSVEIVSLRKQVKLLEERIKKERLNKPERPYEQSRSKSPKKGVEEGGAGMKVLIKTSDTSEGVGGSNFHALRHELEQWKTRYQYVLSENAVLNRQKYDLEIEIERMRREVDVNGVQVLNENKVLRDELERLKAAAGRNLSPNLRAENRYQVNGELAKLKQENEKLREKAMRVADLERALKQYRTSSGGNFGGDNDDDDDRESATSDTSNTSVKRIGQSGKSAKELEKVIALMKKIIVKLQDENNALKRSAGAVANVK